MLDKLLEFGELCRKNGLRVSTAEMLDAVDAVKLTGFDDPEILRGALETTLVKRKADADIFDELYGLYFRRRGDWDAHSADTGDAPPLVEALRKEGLSDEEIEHLVAMLADEAARLSPLARMGLGLRRSHVEALIRLAGVRLDFSRLTNPMQIGFFTQQLLEALNPTGARGELDGMFARLGKRLGQERAELMARVAAEQMNRVRSSLRRYVADEFERRNVDFTEQMKKQILAHKPFGAMSEAELVRLREEVTRLAKKLKQLASLRPRMGRRGRLDARRTLRKALATGGVPFRLVHKRRRIEKPRLVVLCDISDSVRHVSRFMLQFAYTLQELFSKVRSFVFVSDLGECTELFKQHEIQRAVDLAYSGGVVNVYANSNFGRSFKMFEARFLDAVTPKTTVMIIGDARNNYNPPEAWALSAIKEKARRLLWLNPEPPGSWAFGDSAMRDYEPYCDRVETVANLAQLAKVVDTLVL
ncbi:MAG: carbon monoxide dehydrogenase protein [Myxococcales bacterium]|nr:carbon monoxide dehydrogenase protein [Myxococcales bacterium]